MTVQEFINKWNGKADSDGTPLVGIDVRWSNIRPDSKVLRFSGRAAWEKIYDFTPPWYEKEERKPFRDFVGNEKYQGEVRMEREKTQNNKFDHIRRYGLTHPLSPSFVAFAETSGTKGVLGDGCHRFLVAHHLINEENLDLSKDIEKAELEIICLENFSEVIPFDPFG